MLYPASDTKIYDSVPKDTIVLCNGAQVLNLKDDNRSRKNKAVRPLDN